MVAYQEIFDGNFKIRTFDESVNDDELIWHRDRKNRRVFVKDGDGWHLQFDNELPIPLEQGKTYFIDAMRYHRVIKGKNNLIIEIRED